MTAETPLKSYHSHKYSLNFQQIEKTDSHLCQLDKSSSHLHLQSPKCLPSSVRCSKCNMFLVSWTL